MKHTTMVLAGALALVLACGSGGTGDNAAAAGVEDTTAAPTTDLGTPTTDTAADTGGTGTP